MHQIKTYPALVCGSRGKNAVRQEARPASATPAAACAAHRASVEAPSATPRRSRPTAAAAPSGTVSRTAAALPPPAGVPCPAERLLDRLSPAGGERAARGDLGPVAP